MAKNYTEELAGWVKQHAEKRRLQDSAAVAFVAIKSDVVAAMEAGYALTTIWEHMHETRKVKCCYETFRKHVHRFISKPAARRAPSPVVVEAKAGPKHQATGSAAKQPTPSRQSESLKIGGFTFNPSPNKEDLL